MRQLRQQAFGRWNRLIRQNSRGIRGMSDDVYAEYLRDNFITIWQTIGRLLRGSRDARVWFYDGKFGGDGKRHLLHDWQAMLTELSQSESATDRFLAEQLYAPAREAFDQAMEHKEI